LHQISSQISSLKSTCLLHKDGLFFASLRPCSSESEFITHIFVLLGADFTYFSCIVVSCVVRIHHVSCVSWETVLDLITGMPIHVYSISGFPHRFVLAAGSVYNVHRSCWLTPAQPPQSLTACTPNCLEGTHPSSHASHLGYSQFLEFCYKIRNHLCENGLYEFN